MTASKHWVNDLEDLRDFISYVVLYSPDEFPQEDYLPVTEQMTLDKAFDEIRRGLAILDGRIDDKGRLARLHSLIEKSLAAYRRGDDVEGAHLLQAFEQDAFATSD